ncbi:MAG: hypothetical protein SFW66_04495 [Gammaproteobacteria bacterium]|nr:hypothetical protein [Gammaproteobacteria bacterium]
MNKQAGLSLVETLLVAVIIISVMGLGLRIYNQFAQQSQGTRLLFNVDQLFLASRNYYEMMCRQSLNSSLTPTAQSPGTLDPRVVPLATKSLRLTINSASAPPLYDLKQLGLLSAGNWHPNNPLVYVDPATGDATSSYVIQFDRFQVNNKDQTTNVYAYICNGPPGANQQCALQKDAITQKTLAPLDGTPPALQSSTPIWDIKVAVLMNDCTKALEFMAVLGGSCLAQDNGPATPITCMPTPADCASSALHNLYIVWERPIAMVSESSTSPLWVSQPLVKQFNMQYTNDGMAALSGTDSNQNWYDIKSYLCGG